MIGPIVLLDVKRLRVSTITVTTENPQNPFDENAALEALEKLREQIRLARARREQKEEEFEAWVRSNRNAARAERIAAIEREASGTPSASAARAANRGWEAPSTAAPGTGSHVGPRLDTGWRQIDEKRPTDSQTQRLGTLSIRNVAYYAFAVVVVGVIAIGLMWRTGENPQSQTLSSTPTAGAAKPGTPSSASEVPNAVPVPRPAHPLEIELTTTRPVWMRVIVDGDRRVEREVAAGQRLTFGADRAIVLRVGDGGGVRLTNGGRDEGFLGRDGQIAVRTLTVKQP